MQIQIVEALWRQDHAYIISSIKEGKGLGEELLASHLQASIPKYDVSFVLTTLTARLQMTLDQP